MSKELEAFAYIKDTMLEWTKGYEEDLDLIETALKDYEQLKSRENNVLPNDKFIGDLGEHTRDEVAKKLKALEIIKEKRVDIALLLDCDSIENYNYRVDEKWKQTTQRLTKAEYDLLKEVLL